ncbi:MAG: tRNA 4-thiouridine(8) synthase ThiI [Candidatus Omnitrophota bacterium]|nr:MAG: tRNA 4-thiouridine(8) synthase ThiI [Candidatus Omnitrophota bacterium]
MSKAVALFSAGLDSILAVKIAQEEGISVTTLHFLVPFIQGKALDTCEKAVKKWASFLGVDLEIAPLGQEYLEIVKTPRYGYGKNLNPCIDCKMFMLKKAKEVMQKKGASFIVTGEVVGQRPKSQNKSIFAMMDKCSGLEGKVLRPLSAKILPPTYAESEKIVNRDKLYDIYGRGRTLQIKLAKKFGIEEYPQPAGGCLLTDASFCSRVEDLLTHNELNMDNVQLLKLGRHFRFSPSFKFVVGRDEAENNQLQEFLKEDDLYFEPQDLAGPSGLGRGRVCQDVKILAAQIIAKYTSSQEEEVRIKVSTDSSQKIIKVRVISAGKLKQLII